MRAQQRCDLYVATPRALVRLLYCYPIGRSARSDSQMYISDTWGSVGEQSTATVNERASERADCALSAKYARSRNYAEGLSHSSSAVVIAYQRSLVSVAICPTCRAG